MRIFLLQAVFLSSLVAPDPAFASDALLKQCVTRAERLAIQRAQDDELRAKAAELQRERERVTQLFVEGKHVVGPEFLKDQLNVVYDSNGRVVACEGYKVVWSKGPVIKDRNADNAANLNGGVFAIEGPPHGLTVIKLGGIVDNVLSSQSLADYTYNFYVLAKYFELLGGPKVYRVGYVVSPGGGRVPFYEMEHLFPGEQPLFFRDVFGKGEGTPAQKALIVKAGPDGQTPIARIAQTLAHAFELGIEPGELDFAYSPSGRGRPRIVDPANPRVITERTPEEFQFAAMTISDMLGWLREPPLARTLFTNAFRTAIMQIPDSTLAPDLKLAILKGALDSP